MHTMTNSNNFQGSTLQWANRDMENVRRSSVQAPTKNRQVSWSHIPIDPLVITLIVQDDDWTFEPPGAVQFFSSFGHRE